MPAESVLAPGTDHAASPRRPPRWRPLPVTSCTRQARPHVTTLTAVLPLPTIAPASGCRQGPMARTPGDLGPAHRNGRPSPRAVSAGCSRLIRTVSPDLRHSRRPRPPGTDLADHQEAGHRSPAPTHMRRIPTHMRRIPRSARTESVRMPEHEHAGPVRRPRFPQLADHGETTTIVTGPSPTTRYAIVTSSSARA